MLDREQMAMEQDADLRELAELGMSFARKLEARIDLVTNVAEAQALALAFNRIARGVRLTHALRTKLVREHLEIGKLERIAAQKATERRKAQITAVLDREIYVDPHTQDEADEFSERLTERLDQEALFDGFLNEPLEPLVAHFRRHLELPEAPTNLLTSPIEDGGRGTAGRASRRAGGGGGEPQALCSPLAPSTIRSSADGPPPAAKAGEVRKKLEPS